MNDDDEERLNPFEALAARGVTVAGTGGGKVKAIEVTLQAAFVGFKGRTG